ncbi:N-acetylneuraminate synthase family protein [Syntrophaceticus schinkii]|uniref:N-acylneuraminate-9-phosphate synthase n=1 Tax=Syntrophaceticus schinkii TaxID=499207 RepID=A0A0B7MEB9_9FIRM|nr:N-acetylneuraminate synthase family protein [Syntrophaceticus schinkii]CEO88410.1 N-acylneuraminate-9-phosphate synthase [Syntrophaceticus schinkii]
MKDITIGKTTLLKGRVDRPYFIAEAGVNHEGDIEKAYLMIEQASKAGADAIKFQTYKAHKLASKNSPAYWDRSKESSRNQYDLFKKYDVFGENEYISLAKLADENNIDFLSTPFDEEAVEFLDQLVPAFKVASADITNYLLLKSVARKKKPILLSTGASSLSEIYKAVETILDEGNDQIVLLHCILLYPTPYKHANLGMIKHMAQVFPKTIIGYSDHTLPEYMDKILLTSWMLGAQVIEKHFTYDKSLPGNDHYHAMDYSDIVRFREKLEFQLSVMGKFEKHWLKEESAARENARRSIVANRFIPEGKIIEKEDLVLKRPGTGMPAELYYYALGGEALRDIDEDEILAFKDIILNDSANK